MRGFFGRIMYSIQAFMYGRNGMDRLNRFLLILSIVLTLLSNIPFLGILYFVSSGILIWMAFRMFSKNLYNRQKENAKYTEIKYKMFHNFPLYKKMFTERKTHKYFKCPVCKTWMRVPKGKGKIEITCPKCHNKTVRKS